MFKIISIIIIGLTLIGCSSSKEKETLKETLKEKVKETSRYIEKSISTKETIKKSNNIKEPIGKGKVVDVHYKPGQY